MDVYVSVDAYVVRFDVPYIIHVCYLLMIPGASFGLNLMLNIEQYEYMTQLSTENGVKVRSKFMTYLIKDYATSRHVWHDDWLRWDFILSILSPPNIVRASYEWVNWLGSQNALKLLAYRQFDYSQISSEFLVIVWLNGCRIPYTVAICYSRHTICVHNGSRNMQWKAIYHKSKDIMMITLSFFSFTFMTRMTSRSCSSMELQSCPEFTRLRLSRTLKYSAYDVSV